MEQSAEPDTPAEQWVVLTGGRGISKRAPYALLKEKQPTSQPGQRQPDENTFFWLVVHAPMGGRT
eukprot:582731-Pelagomonas_calceolata.AAC.3